MTGYLIGAAMLCAVAAALVVVRQLAKLEEERALRFGTFTAVSEARTRAEAALAELRSQLKSLAGENSTLIHQRTELHVQLAAMTEALQQERKHGATHLQVQNKEHGESFGRQLDDFRRQIQEAQANIARDIQDSQVEIAREHAALGTQIRQSTEQVAGLTRALRGETRTQGAWGEMILESVLERSGLRKGEEYCVQQTHLGEAGQRLRPDVLVNFPGGQRMVIDSKVSLNAFDAHVNAEPGSVAAKDALIRHTQAIRSHIKSLGSKDYFAGAGSPLDCVLMFMAIEGALAAALREDPDLTAYAMEQNVVLTSPATLMVALRTVKNVWHVERRNQNAELISQQAGRIYDKLVAFLEDFEGVGRRLDQARDSHKLAFQKLRSGRGSILDQAEEMRRLGAKTAKLLPMAASDSDETQVAAASA